MIYEDFLNLIKNLGENQEANFTGDKTTGYDPGCNDIPGGFQDVNPVIFTMLGEIVGAVISNKLPLNVQNALGNWIELIGQVILTYSAQQQYFQAGPGRYYDVRNKNITNSFCPEASEQGAGASPSPPTEDSNTGNGCSEEITQLKEMINNLTVELECLKMEMKNMKDRTM